MTSYQKRLNQTVRQYDSNLFVQETHAGRTDLYRKTSHNTEPPHFIFSLTDSWTAQGRPIEYGTEVVMQRIKANDLWRDDKFVENYIASCEKRQESKDRDLKNNIESFLYDFRSQFHKATSDINTSGLKKIYREEK